jgi:hypothetical protein
MGHVMIARVANLAHCTTALGRLQKKKTHVRPTTRTDLHGNGATRHPISWSIDVQRWTLNRRCFQQSRKQSRTNNDFDSDRTLLGF